MRELREIGVGVGKFRHDFCEAIEVGRLEEQIDMGKAIAQLTRDLQVVGPVSEPKIAVFRAVEARPGSSSSPSSPSNSRTAVSATGYWCSAISVVTWSAGSGRGSSPPGGLPAELSFSGVIASPLHSCVLVRLRFVAQA